MKPRDASRDRQRDLLGDRHDAHAFELLGESRYLLTIPELNTDLEIDHVRRDRRELRGELTVHCGLAGASTFRGTLVSCGFQFVQRPHAPVDGEDARDPRADERRGRLGGYPSSRSSVSVSVKPSPVGAPAVQLRDVAKPSPDDVFDVDGLRLLKRHPSIAFGDGGSLKSYLALYVAGRLAQAGVRVGLFDWELCGEDHRDRAERLFGASVPDILYVRCTRPLSSTRRNRLSRFRHEHDLDYAVFDSVAFACDGPPEAAETAAGYLRAVRSDRYRLAAYRARHEERRHGRSSTLRIRRSGTTAPGRRGSRSSPSRRPSMAS